MELQEYHCKICGKLLCKGILKCVEDILEVKCRNCHNVCLFTGTDADIIKKRSVLIKTGEIPDPEKD